MSILLMLISMACWVLSVTPTAPSIGTPEPFKHFVQYYESEFALQRHSHQSIHVGLRAAACVDYLKPLEIKRLILQQAYFGGTKRTESESRLANDQGFPLRVNDLMWELPLPIGADRDHQYSNPFLAINSDQVDRLKILGWNIFVTDCSGDPLMDRQGEMVKMLENTGVSVVNKSTGGGFHGHEIFEPFKARLFSALPRDFIFDPQQVNYHVTGPDSVAKSFAN